MTTTPQTVVAPAIVLVVAAAENGVIGRGGTMPWHLPSDLKTFRRLTMGKPVVMGRKTFQSIGKALPGRDNIVITRDAAFSAPGVERVASVTEALDIARRHAAARGVTEIAVIGGGDIYAQVLPLAARIYFTRVHAQPDGDTRFPDLPLAEWQIVHSEPIPAMPADDHACTLLVYERIH